MSNRLQTVIPAAATFLVGYQGALTRTSRLRKSICCVLLRRVRAGEVRVRSFSTNSRPALRAATSGGLPRAGNDTTVTGQRTSPYTAGDPVAEASNSPTIHHSRPRCWGARPTRGSGPMAGLAPCAARPLRFEPIPRHVIVDLPG
jgi:hypothetical protein